MTDLADLHTTKLSDGWNSEKYQDLRKKIAEGRQNYDFCKHCDFIDAGFRMQVVKAILDDNADAANTAGGQQRTGILS